MLTDVTCSHCGAANQILVPDDHTGALRWECTSCGGVSVLEFGPMSVVDGDGGSSVDTSN